jgi:hypothetical protein
MLKLSWTSQVCSRGADVDSAKISFLTNGEIEANLLHNGYQMEIFAEKNAKEV